MKNKNIFISLLCISFLVITSNIFTITSSAGVSDNLYQISTTEIKNDITSLVNSDNTINNKITKNTSNISKLDTKIDNQNTSLLGSIGEAINNSNSNNKELQDQIDELKNQYKNIYSIGDCIITFNNENPATKFGGNWEKVSSGRMLMSGDVAGQTGGNNSVRLESSQIPSLSVSGSTVASTTGSTGNGYSIIHGYTTRTTTTNGNHSHSLYSSSSYQNQWLGNALLDDTNGYSPNEYGWGRVPNTSENGNHAHNYDDYYATSISGVQAHTHSIPSLTVNANYTNNSQQSIDITNSYITVIIWKRIS